MASMHLRHPCIRAICALMPSVHSCVTYHALTPSRHSYQLCTHAICAFMPRATHALMKMLLACRISAAYVFRVQYAALQLCSLAQAQAWRRRASVSACRRPVRSLPMVCRFIICISSRSLPSLHLVYHLWLATSNFAVTCIPCNRCAWCIPLRLAIQRCILLCCLHLAHIATQRCLPLLCPSLPLALAGHR